MSKHIHIATGSTMSRPGDVSGNLDQIIQLARRAAADGADLLLTPELSASGYGPYSEVLATAETAGEGPIYRALAAAAGETGVAICAGFVEALRGKQYLAHAVIHPDGSWAVQRKHRVTKNEQPLATDSHLVYESEDDEIGQPAGPSAFSVFEVRGVKCAFAICADAGLRDLSPHLASLGVELLLCPAAGGGRREDRVTTSDLLTPEGRNKYLHWLRQTFFPSPPEAVTDCIRYCRGLAAVNQCGYDGRKCCHLGHSFIVNPMGEILAVAQGYPNLDRQVSAYLHAVMDVEDRLMPPAAVVQHEIESMKKPLHPANKRQWVIREQCGQAWVGELLHFSVSWNPLEQPDANLVMVGPQGVLPTQVTDLVYHPDGSVAGATIWCRVDLDPNEERDLRLESGVGSAIPEALHWRKSEDGGFIAANGVLEVKIPDSGCYEAGNVPGPVRSVRPPGGEWIGRGFVKTELAVVLSVQLQSTGPLFVQWTVRAHHERRTLALAECTLYSGENFVRFRESTSRDSEIDFVFDTFPGMEPDRLMHHGGTERAAAVLEEIDYARSGQLCVVDFNSGHQQMSNAWFGCCRDGISPFIGVVELEGAQWTNTSVNRIFLQADPPESLQIVSPWRGGRKEWALVCSTVAANSGPDNTGGCVELGAIHRRFAQIPLQKVHGWVLDWPVEMLKRPLLQSGEGSIKAGRARVASSPELQRCYRALEEHLRGAPPAGFLIGSRSSSFATVWLAFGEERHAHAAIEEMEQEVRRVMDAFWHDGAFGQMCIFPGRLMKLWLQTYDVLKAAGFLEGEQDRRFRRDFALLAYVMADPEFFPKHSNLRDLNDPDAFFQGLGRLVGDAMCPPNFQTEYFTTYGMMGCCFPDHPMARAWREEAEQFLEQMLDVHFYDSGAYSESPNYHSHSLTMTLQLALALRRGGGRDFFQHLRFKAQFEYFCQMQTPPILMNEAGQKFMDPYRMMDPERRRYAMLPGNGNTATDCSDMSLPAELAIAAAVYRESDPVLSARCMTAWLRTGRPVANAYNNLTFLLTADPDLPGCEKLGLRSALLTGAFATFRGNPESADEVFVLTKNGTATHHNDFDEGGFTIWAYGAPVASDFGYNTLHEGRRNGAIDTWKHNCVEFDGKSSGYRGIERTLPPEQWISTGLADLLVSNLSNTNLRDLKTMAYWDQIPIEPIEYWRYTLFVKPHYLLIFDSIQKCAYAHRWWLHAQARDISVDGPRVRFSGAFGIDLLAHFVTPAVPAIEKGEWGGMKHISAGQVRAKDWRVLVAPLKPEQNFQVSSDASGRVVFVETAEYRDTLCLARFSFHYEDENMQFFGRAGVFRAWKDGRREVELLDGEEMSLRTDRANRT